MSYADAERPLTPEEQRELIDSMARAVVARRLETPFLFFLEANRPLSFMAGQALLAGAPFLGALFGFSRVHHWARMLEDRDSVDRLSRRVEELVAARRHDARPGGLNCAGVGCDAGTPRPRARVEVP